MIDECKVGVDGGTCRKGKATRPTAAGWANMGGHGITQLDSGRWPANLIFQHLPSCRQDDADVLRYPQDKTWICARGCPKMALDEQSGILMGRGDVTSLGHGVNTIGLLAEGIGRADKPPRPDLNDSGGASRFFKQVGGGMVTLFGGDRGRTG